MTIRLYYAPKTRAGRVRWLLEELGADYELVPVDRAGGECERPEYRLIHPLGKVPALDDGGTKIFESAAIILHLADKFPEKGLAPEPGSKERGLYYQWIVFNVATVEATAVGYMLASDDEAKQRALADLSEALDVVAKALDAGGPYLLGEAFSAADVMIGSTLLWGKALGWLEGKPTLEAYAERLGKRKAYLEALVD
ncbi:MAG TPA: glutathione S-transferase family protein [Planctomycetes bacterium]|nr:glutathione S-transferase family protein [Planctomycetota bacterium]